VGPASTPDPVEAILAAHGIRGPWAVLPTTGIANRIYATPDVVLRVASDHPEALGDARTESVAAPVARAAGIHVPRLIAFDDSRVLVDRPYSLWERVHARTVGESASEPVTAPRVWRDLGNELCRLHARVRTCDDPQGWLDDPTRRTDPAQLVSALGAQPWIERDTVARLERWLTRLHPSLDSAGPPCFLHNDAHGGNLLCSADDRLVALIDWGDAGWGDPAIELASVPLAAVPLVVAGYESEGGRFGGDAEARILFDQIAAAIEDAAGEHGPRRLEALLAFVRNAPARWRRLSW
jgi:aminoglycoside phosphotransferase (APT) family kinase protein